MAYCTTDDVRTLTGIDAADTSEADLIKIIASADRRCNIRLSSAGVDIPQGTPEELMEASSHFAAAALIDRKRTNLSRTAGYTADGVSYTNTPDTEIQRHDAVGTRALEQYISNAGGGTASTYMYVVEGV